MNQGGHFSDLDGMRGLLAVTVMLHHMGLNTIVERLLGIEGAVWGVSVDFFFVLSGFVLCKSVCSRPIDSARFAYKRFWRLFPMHVAILLLFSFVLLPPESTKLDYLLEYAAIPPFLGQGMANGPAWSMAFEFYIPIVLVALVPWPRLGRTIVQSGSASLILIYAFISYHHTAFGNWELFMHVERPVRAFVGLTFGFFLWRLLEDQSGSATRRDNAIFLGLSVAFFPLVLLAAVEHLFGALFPLLFALSMFFGMRSNGPLSKRPFQFIGKLSFGIYMVHMPVILLYLSVFGSEAMDGNIPLKLSIVAVSIASAAVLHHAVELPGVRLGRRLVLGRRFSAAG